MQRVSRSQAAQIQKLSDKFGSVEFRTLLTGEGRRLIRPERLANLQSGRGKLSESEARQLKRINANSSNLGNLIDKRKSEPKRQRVRAAKTWLKHGKTKDTDWGSLTPEEKDQYLPAIRSLSYLGVDPESGTYYVRE